jgi:hypothetical protein
MAKGRALKRVGIGCLGLVVVLAALVAFTGPGKDVQNLWRNGAIQALLFPPAKRTYTATNESNLKALHTALMLYHESEGQFPAANGWMDAIGPRIATSDMAAGESEKKLVRPDLAGKANEFGYGLNAKAAGKYKDDVGDGKTLLIYESKQTARNAAGDPATDRDGMAITIDGTIVR